MQNWHVGNLREENVQHSLGQIAYYILRDNCQLVVSHRSATCVGNRLTGLL